MKAWNVSLAFTVLAEDEVSAIQEYLYAIRHGQWDKDWLKVEREPQSDTED